MSERKVILERLISFVGPLDFVLRDLAKLSWDSKVELVFLSPKHLSKVLATYIDGRVTAKEIEMWANAIESRDDIGFESQETTLCEIIHELANPLITRSLSYERAKELLKKLRV